MNKRGSALPSSLKPDVGAHQAEKQTVLRMAVQNLLERFHMPCQLVRTRAAHSVPDPGLEPVVAGLVPRIAPMCCVSLCDVDPIMTLSPGDRDTRFLQPSNSSEAEDCSGSPETDSSSETDTLEQAIREREFYASNSIVRELGLGGLVMRCFGS